MSTASDDAGKKIFFFFVENRIEVTESPMTGAAIKQAIKANVPGFDVTHDLILEGHGSEQDRLIKDDESVNLAHGHGERPKTFFSKPPTNFG